MDLKMSAIVASLPALIERPLVSVLMPNFNYGAFIGRAIDSVLSQSYPNFELIICDDGSTDGSTDRIQASVARDGRVRLLRQCNGGQASALNAAFAESRGDLIVYLDSDDFFAPDKLELVVAELRKDNAGLLLHSMVVVDKTGQSVMTIPAFKRLEHGWLAPSVLRRGGRWQLQPSSALCFRREMARYVFPIPEQEFRTDADGFTATLLALLTTVATLDLPLSYYRIHGANLGGNLVAGRYMDRLASQRGIDLCRRLTDGVNHRLAQFGIDDRQIDLERNLFFAECRFYLDLLGGDVSRLRLWREFVRIARLLSEDDLYSVLRKVCVVPIYGLSVWLPVAPRRTLLSRVLPRVLGRSKAKEVARRILRSVAWRRRPGTAAATPYPRFARVPLGTTDSSTSYPDGSKSAVPTTRAGR